MLVQNGLVCTIQSVWKKGADVSNLKDWLIDWLRILVSTSTHNGRVRIFYDVKTNREQQALPCSDSAKSQSENTKWKALIIQSIGIQRCT